VAQCYGLDEINSSKNKFACIHLPVKNNNNNNPSVLYASRFV